MWPFEPTIFMRQICITALPPDLDVVSWNVWRELLLALRIGFRLGGGSARWSLCDGLAGSRLLFCRRMLRCSNCTFYICRTEIYQVIMTPKLVNQLYSPVNEQHGVERSRSMKGANH